MIVNDHNDHIDCSAKKKSKRNTKIKLSKKKINI